MLINIALSAQENILALINEKVTGTPTAANQIVIGLPTAPGGTAGPRNTDLEIEAAAEEGLTGSTIVNYDRLGLDTGVATPVLAYTQGESETDADLLIRIAGALGLRADQLTWAVAPAPTPGGAAFAAEIGIVADSLLYTGANLTVQISMDEPTDVEALFGGEQDGFDPVE